MNSKVHLINLIKHWAKRTGRQFTEAAKIMRNKGLEITLSQFQSNFRNHPERVTVYDSLEIMLLIHAFHDGIPSRNSPRAFEALLAFKWANVTPMERMLVDLFGEKEMELARNKFEEYVGNHPYTFEEYLNILPLILGRDPMPDPAFDLNPTEDNNNNLTQQIEAAVKAYWGGKHHSAKDILERLLKESLANEQKGLLVPELVEIYHQLGILHTNRENYDDAEKYLANALERAKQTNPPQPLSAIYGNLAFNAYSKSDYRNAKKHYQNCYNEAQKAGLIPVIVFAQTGLAAVDMENLQYAQALEGFKRAYLTALEENLKNRAAYAALNLSYLHMMLEHNTLAEDYLAKGFEHIQGIDQPNLEAQLHLQKARLMAHQKDNYTGDCELALALQLAEETNNRWLAQTIRIEFAKSHLRGYRDVAALSQFKELLTYALSVENREWVTYSVYGIIFSLLAQEFIHGKTPGKTDLKSVRQQINEQMTQKIQSIKTSSSFLDKTIEYFRIGLDNYPASIKKAAKELFYQFFQRL